MQPAPRARAVAAAPVDALLARADELARRWAIALILSLPLERIGEFPLESFARQAPREPDAAARATHARAAGEVAQADREPSVECSQRSPLGDGVVIVDEGYGPARPWSHARGDRERAKDAAEPAPAPTVLARAGARRGRARGRPWDTPLEDGPAGPAHEPA